MRKQALIIFALGALVALPQSAFAQTNPGIEQYEENAPTAGGDRPSSGGQTGTGGGGDGSGSGSAGTGSVDSGGSTASGTASGDANAGAAGAPSDASGSRQGDGSRQDTRQGTPEAVTSAAAEQGSSPVRPLGAEEDSPDEGGMGVALPIVLAASLVAALAFVVARRMRGRHAPAA
jgi:hypothetical protein